MPSKKSPFRFSRILARLDKAIAALNASSITSMVIETVTLQKTDVVTKLQAIRAPLKAVVDAEKAFRDAVTKRNASTADLDFLTQFYTALPSYVGSKSTALEDYGKKVPKTRAPQTVEEKQAANVKRAATRKARGIMGSKQRAAIKAPVESPAPAEPPAPVPAPAAGAKTGA